MSRGFCSTIIIILASLLLGATGVPSGGDSKASGPSKEAATPTNQKPAKPSPAAPDLNKPAIPENGKQNSPQNAEAPGGNDPNWTDKAITMFTGILMLVGIAQVIVYLRQAHYMREGLDITRQALEATKKAADATVESVKTNEKIAEAARQSAGASKLALKADRPYLLLESAKLNGVEIGAEETYRSLAYAFGDLRPYKDFSPEATFTFRNYGKGPALIDKILAEFSPKVEPPEHRDFSECRDLPLRVGAVGADKQMKISIQMRRVTEEDYAAVQSETKKMLAYGVVIYRDVLGEGYETGFSWLYDLRHFDSNAMPASGGTFRHSAKDDNYKT
jgi:hypothetical protein